MLDRHNDKLEKVRIRQKGNFLYLRATLPPKTGTGKWKQQELSTGCPANDHGIKAAFGRAQRLESDLIFDRFTWDDWQKTEAPIAVEGKTIEQWINEFEKEHWEINQKTVNRASCFKRDCLDYLHKLPLDEPLTVEVVRKTLIKWEPQSRGRRFAYTAFTRLAKYAGVELPTDWSKYRGTYQPSNKRHIPSDDEIIQTWESLTGPWKWAYAVLACYGIRNHEIVHLDFSGYPVIKIGPNTKTGTRLSYPLYPEWADLMECDKINAPSITAKLNRDIGNTVGKAFRRLGVTHTAYSLRDAYAVRSARLNVSPAIAAKWMGHSLTVHNDHYLKYTSKVDYDEIWNNLKK